MASKLLPDQKILCLDSALWLIYEIGVLMWRDSTPYRSQMGHQGQIIVTGQLNII